MSDNNEAEGNQLSINDFDLHSDDESLTDWSAIPSSEPVLPTATTDSTMLHGSDTSSYVPGDPFTRPRTNSQPGRVYSQTVSALSQGRLRHMLHGEPCPLCGRTLTNSRHPYHVATMCPVIKDRNKRAAEIAAEELQRCSRIDDSHIQWY